LSLLQKARNIHGSSFYQCNNNALLMPAFDDVGFQGSAASAA